MNSDTGSFWQNHKRKEKSWVPFWGGGIATLDPPVFNNQNVYDRGSFFHLNKNNKSLFFTSYGN